jgi:two-component system, NarL family, response regulator LiaR
MTTDAQTERPVSDDSRIPIRTLVVDDSAVLLEKLCHFLETQPLMELVGTAAQGQEALFMAELLRPDLVLMDLNMPLMDGLQATAMLRRRFPEIRVILLAFEDHPNARDSAHTHGAHGFVDKARIISDLMPAIGRVFGVDPADAAGAPHGAEPLARRMA